MGFDASRAMRELDAQRDSIVPSHIASASNLSRQYENIARDLSGIDQLRRSIQGSIVPAIGDVRSAEMLTRHLLPYSVRRGLPGLSGNLAGLSYFARMQSDMQARKSGYLSLSSSIAQAFEAHGFDSAYSAAWSLHRVQSFRTSTLRSLLKTTATFGPIVISPNDEDAPFDYQPDLQGWLLPETATESGDDIDVEELLDVVFAYTLGIAQHHRTKALVTFVGKHGGTILIRVAEDTVAALIVYWLLNR